MERENHNKDGAIPPHQAGKSPHPTPMMLINEISKLFGQRMRRASEQAGIPDGYRWILFHLGHRKSATQLELSKLTHTTPPTISITLRNMEADGYVKRTQDKEDMRVIHVSLTEKGLAVEEANRHHADATDRLAMTGMSDEEREVLRNLLIRMRDNIAVGGSENRHEPVTEGKGGFSDEE